MFTLWYLYLGVQEFRRRGIFHWLKLRNITDPFRSEPNMEYKPSESSSPVSSNTGIYSTENPQDSTSESVKPSNSNDKREQITPTAQVKTSSVSDKTKIGEPSESSNEYLIAKEIVPIKESTSNAGKFLDDDEVTNTLLVKDSKLLHKERKQNDIDKSVLPAETEKKTIFNDKSKFQAKNENVETPNDSRAERNTGSIPAEAIRSPPGRGLGRVLIEGSDEPMRCWLTEGDHPNHPAGMNADADNIKVITNRARDSADSILRDSDELIRNERHLARKTSWPKKVSISEEPPTTFIRDIPPAENPETGPDTTPMEKLKREAELAAAAAAALKEDWRKKMERKGQTGTTDLDEDENIIFGDSDNRDEGQILQISDEESSDHGFLSDRM